ncbi:hypothetical protein [Microbacterium sp. RURRCA19A]|uniref:YobI family P-loop NTPase n=1 Tax=Microbacterium sp. RURRCA19A TaxID=1907391 RepID=UPI000956C8C0|nr:hypothetical protein [Microbacterium sp. RURRCA19A]SIR92288.1 hypothetical protein SAMN05880568_1825 [Microbacterium sp. RURRCA19A]
MPDAPEPAAKDSISLRSLAPSYDEERHGVYLRALVRALREQDDVRNIALTGAYGTGKSSVLQHLGELDEFKDRVLELSLSTVGVAEEQPDGSTQTNPAAWTKTNLIQKEIVKQILYRDAPERTRGSRFRRLSRFRVWREAGVAMGLGVLVLAVLWLSGLAAPLLTFLGDDPALGWVVLAGLGLLAILSGVIYAIRWLTHNRVFLEKLSAGPATVSLAATSSSYFDQYMDEIVYFFERSGRDIVIFEDIDRFEDPHIFETLRALNTLLNGTEQVRGRRRIRTVTKTTMTEAQADRAFRKSDSLPEVKFIYALRDSVFEKLGDDTATDDSDTSEPARSGARADAADDEVRRANRTKFFDIVIPIVPFITHRNARDLMLDAMDGTEVSPDLINVVARFVADMRLITDMRNEYDIYADRLLGTPNQMPGIDADRLFALIVYKCVHMADFEAIRFGSSDLDRLHDAWRGIVKAAVVTAQARERAAAEQLAIERTLDNRARQLGDRLELVMRATPVGQHYSEYVQLRVGNTPHEGPQLRSPALWTQLSNERPALAFTNRQTGHHMSLSTDQLQTLMGTPIDAAQWAKVDRAAQIEVQRQAQVDIAFLRHHAWSEICERSEFQSSAEGGKVAETFEQAVARILKSRLARALVASGYLNEYFALYVSIYYGQHLRPRALNYIVHALDRGAADIHAELDPEDVEAIIGDKGTDIFRDRAAYNIRVLDHLLVSRPGEAEMIVRHVAAWGRDDRDFAEAYLQAGTSRARFVRILARLLPTKIADIVIGAPGEVLGELIDVALASAGAEIGEPSTGEFADLVIEHYAKFPSISTPAPTSTKVMVVPKPAAVDAIAKLGIQLPATAPLNSIARSRVIELGAYELNAVNIENLTGQPSLALDAIRANSEAVYAAALGRMTKYLAIIAGQQGAVTVDDPHQFLPVLASAHDAAVADEDLQRIVEAASAHCHVDAIADAPEGAWRALAATRRVTVSAANLLAYLDRVGALDESIGLLLGDVEAVELPGEVADAERNRLAVAIISARQVIPSAVHRVMLAASLELAEPIPPASLTPERGEIVGLMIAAGLLADEEATFSSSLVPDWPTREAALIRSSDVPVFISPAVLPEADIPAFLRSTVVSTRLKDAVLSNLAVFIPGASRTSIRALGSTAAASGTDAPFAVIDQLRAAGAPDESVVALLAASTTVTLDELRAELRALGDPYPSIADRGSGRPLVPDDVAHRKVLDRLKAAGIVSDHKPERERRRVSLRRQA